MIGLNAKPTFLVLATKLANFLMLVTDQKIILLTLILVLSSLNPTNALFAIKKLV